MQHVPFPLYHGTSSHFRGLFEVGGTTRLWPHIQDAISLYRAAWKQLQSAGINPSWYQAKILGQSTGHSNWQHGEIYVAASQVPAMRYAQSGAAYGGEILTECAEALDRIGAMDAAAAASLRARFPALGSFLAGGGSPLLIVIDNVPISALAPEAGKGSVDEEIRAIEGHYSDMNGALLQACLAPYQFRVRTGCGTVRDIIDLDV